MVKKVWGFTVDEHGISEITERESIYYEERVRSGIYNDGHQERKVAIYKFNSYPYELTIDLESAKEVVYHESGAETYWFNNIEKAMYANFCMISMNGL